MSRLGISGIALLAMPCRSPRCTARICASRVDHCLPAFKSLSGEQFLFGSPSTRPPRPAAKVMIARTDYSVRCTGDSLEEHRRSSHAVRDFSIHILSTFFADRMGDDHA